MKNLKNIFGIIALMALITLSITACELDPHKTGTLTVYGLSMDVQGVVVYTNGVPTTQMQFRSLVSLENAKAESTGMSSPFYLFDINDKPFMQSGTFLVVILDFPEIFYIHGVEFRNGFATIWFDEMSSFTSLPLW